MDNLQTIGSFIQTAREQKGISIAELADVTRINLKLLQHLENDELNQLPNKIYVVGFVKCLAKTLQLDEKESLEVLNYTYEQKLSHQVVKEEESVVETDSERIDLEDNANAILKTYFNKKVFIAFLILVLFFIIIRSLITFIEKVSQESNSRINNTQEIEVTDTSVKSKDSNLFDLKVNEKLQSNDNEENETKDIRENETIIKVEKKVEPKPVVVQEDSPKKPEKKKEAPKVEKRTDGKFPFKKFYTAPTNLYTINADAQENQDTSLLPEKYKNSVIADKQNVFIHALTGDTWISFKVDDDKIKRYVLKKGRKVLLKGDRVLLFMGNLNVAKIFLNNKLINTSTKTGVKSLIFPQEVASEYQFPLFPSYQYKSYTAQEYIENMAEKE